MTMQRHHIRSHTMQDGLDRESRIPGGLAAIGGGLLILIGALLYYASYIDAGFNTADDGHYAQVAYELWLGTDPHGLRFGYGMLWFKIGEGLFTLGGPSWLTVQWIFQGLSALTALLVYASVLRVTGRILPALLGAGVAAAVPAFPPTVFYAVCVLLNVFLQLRAADRWRRMSSRDLIGPAAGLSLTFQIRPDFGFIFAATLAGLLLLGAAAGGWRGSAGRLTRLGGAALAVFLAVQAPLMLAAAAGGYLDLILTEYLRYPKTLLQYLAAGLGMAGGGAAGGAAADGAGALLARPSLSNLLSGDRNAAAMALLVHLPLLNAAIFTLSILVRLRRAETATGVPARLVALAGGVAALPHYYLFRPDLAHIANFMPGHIAMVCVLLTDLVVSACRREGRLPRLMTWTAALPAILLPAFGLAVYLWIGLTTPGTGSIANAAGRTEPFTARNGTATLLAPGEYTLLEGLRRAVEEHSQPGDRIVCVPFCPGVAFMTGRRMLLRDWYVDDSLLITDPGWIGRAIAQTREARPPVVIVGNAGINGTEISRFRNWARPYVEMLEATATGKLELPETTVYLMPR